ncbi:MAG: hypothetical protein MHM6MM_002930 [Cercozoa sp. M6MM]
MHVDVFRDCVRVWRDGVLLGVLAWPADGAYLLASEHGSEDSVTVVTWDSEELVVARVPVSVQGACKRRRLQRSEDARSVSPTFQLDTCLVTRHCFARSVLVVLRLSRNTFAGCSDDRNEVIVFDGEKLVQRHFALEAAPLRAALCFTRRAKVDARDVVALDDLEVALRNKLSSNGADEVVVVASKHGSLFVLTSDPTDQSFIASKLVELDAADTAEFAALLSTPSSIFCFSQTSVQRVFVENDPRRRIRVMTFHFGRLETGTLCDVHLLRRDEDANMEQERSQKSVGGRRKLPNLARQFLLQQQHAQQFRSELSQFCFVLKFEVASCDVSAWWLLQLATRGDNLVTLRTVPCHSEPRDFAHAQRVLAGELDLVQIARLQAASWRAESEYSRACAHSEETLQQVALAKRVVAAPVTAHCEHFTAQHGRRFVKLGLGTRADLAGSLVDSLLA